MIKAIKTSTITHIYALYAPFLMVWGYYFDVLFPIIPIIFSLRAEVESDISKERW